MSCTISGFFNFHVSHLNHETFKLCLQNTLNMSKTIRVYFRVLQVMFDFYVLYYLLYSILLLDKNYRQYLVRYIIFIYIRYDVNHLKKTRILSASCASNP